MIFVKDLACETGKSLQRREDAEQRVMHKERLKTFLFDAFEGLNEIEIWLKEDNEEILRYIDKKEGWLERELYSRNPLVAYVFEWLANKAREQEDETRCLLLGKAIEILQISPYAEWMSDYIEKQCKEIKDIPNGQSKSWLLGEICKTLHFIGNKTKTEQSFFELLDSLQSMEEEEQARCCVYLAEGISGLNDLKSWVGRIYEKIIEKINLFQAEERILETSLSLHESIFGHEHLKTELTHDPNVALQSLRCLLLMNNNHNKWKGHYARRLFFASKETIKQQVVDPDRWNQGLQAFDQLEDWLHHERNIAGETLWSYSGKMLLIMFLQRDFAGYWDRSWAFRYFEALLERTGQLKERREREDILRIMGMKLWKNPKENEPMISLLFLEGEKLVKDFSCVYEGIAQCEIEAKEWLQAERTTKMIKDKAAQDRLFKSILQGYIEGSHAEKAVSLLRSFHQREARKEAMMWCATSPVVGENPIACAMLCEEALVELDDAEEVYGEIVKNLGLNKEAKKALAKESIEMKQKEMDARSRKERLQELEFLEKSLPREVYKERRKDLIGLIKKEGYETSKETAAETAIEKKIKNQEQEKPKKQKILVDKPHRYGGDHYCSPKDHIEKNHFSKEVGGSLFTLWSSFESMWADMEEYVEQVIAEENEKEIYIIEKQFPLEVGQSKVIRLKEAPINSVEIEIRNGQACLVCNDRYLQTSTDWMTIIVGKSQIEPDEIEGYSGHTKRLALYSAYPGRPSCPFPRCKTEQEKEELSKALKDIVHLLEKGAREDAQKAMDCAYRKLGDDEQWARYWSEHLLLR